ncbi:MAG: glycosyltransferase family 4 protein [Xanthomonadales bacterium]|nr:glycosyltransferase family 4 protein [Xanthomonadales bacterium]
MRILLVHDYGTLNGGAEIMAVNLRDALRARGHQALLFSSSARPLPLPVVADETCYGTTGALRRVLKAVNPHAAVRLRRVLRAFRPDLVFVKMFLSQLSPLILPALRGVPSVLSIVNYNLVCPLNTKTLPDGTQCHSPAGRACHANGCLPWLGVARDRVQRSLTDLDVFDRIVANSRWVMERLSAEGVRVDSYIHNGIPVTEPRPGIGSIPLVAYAGRLMHKKGVDVLLDAMALLARRVPRARLLVAGDGPERARLERQARAAGLETSVAFLGHLDPAALHRALAPAWVQAVPSRWEEPFGLVAAEAMMRGTAVVASDAGGLVEQVLEGETGFRVPAGDPAALAAALERVLADRDVAERFGANGRDHALANFAFEVYADRMIRVFEQVIVEARE